MHMYRCGDCLNTQSRKGDGKSCKSETWLKAHTLPIHDSSIHLGEGLLHSNDGSDCSISSKEGETPI